MTAASATSLDGFYTIAANGQIRITAAGVAAGIENNDFETGLNSFSYGIEAGDVTGNWSAAENISLNVTDVDESRAGDGRRPELQLRARTGRRVPWSAS